QVVVHALRDLLDRVEEVDEQRARLMALQRPVLQVVEQLARVDSPRGEAPLQLQPDQDDDDRAEEPPRPQAASPAGADRWWWGGQLSRDRPRRRDRVGHQVRSSMSEDITARRSTTPTTWSPSTTRISSSEPATSGSSSCTIVSAGTVGVSPPVSPSRGRMIVRAVRTCARGTSFVKSAT